MFCWKSIGLIHPGAPMRRTVAVLRNGANVAVQIRVEMLPTLAMVNAPRDDVPHVRDDAGTDEQLPLGVVINAPGIAEAVGDNFKFVLSRMIAPYSTIDVNSLTIEDVLRKRVVVLVNPAFTRRFAHFGGRSKTLTTIQPAIGPPMQTIQGFVPIADAPTRQAYFNVVHIGHIVVVFVGYKKQVGWCAQKQAIKAHRDGGGKGNTF